MSAAQAERLAPARVTVVSRSRGAALARRVGIGYLVALVAAPPVTAGVLFLGGHFDAEPVAPVSRVVESQCLNGRIQQGIDTGRPDGLLLAYDTGVSC